MEKTKDTVSTFSISGWLRQNIQASTIILAMFAIWIIFSIWSQGSYLGPQNISNLFRQMTVTAILSIGMVLVIVTGGIDLSVGKFAGFISVIVAYLQVNVWTAIFPDQPLIAAILSIFVGAACGILLGIIQGYVIAYMSVPSFIVTLGAQWIFNGAILLVTGGKTIPANQPYFTFFAQGYLPAWLGWVFGLIIIGIMFFLKIHSRKQRLSYGFKVPGLIIDLISTIIFSFLIIVYIIMVNQYNGVQMPVLIMLLAAVIVSYVADNTPFGRHVYAIGGNKEAARLSGINIRYTLFITFVLMGLLCAISGILLASYVGYGTISAGTGYELDAIAACILGGTSTLGGIGTIPMALVGSLIMASITNGLQVMNIGPAWQYMVKGAVLIVAVFADIYFKKNR